MCNNIVAHVLKKILAICSMENHLQDSGNKIDCFIGM